MKGDDNNDNCVLDCPAKTNCVAQTCCGPQESPKLTANPNGVYKPVDEFTLDSSNTGFVKISSPDSHVHSPVVDSKLNMV